METGKHKSTIEPLDLRYDFQLSDGCAYARRYQRALAEVVNQYDFDIYCRPHTAKIAS